jgi:hypothetical protein
MLLGPAASRAAQKTSKPSPADWTRVLRTVREIALADDEPDKRRINAISAYARLRAVKRQYDDGLKFCQEVLKGTGKNPVFHAAIRAACFLTRHRDGHLDGGMHLLNRWAKRGAHKNTAATVRKEILGIISKLKAPSPQKTIRGAVTARIPSWAHAAPGKIPSALNVPLLKGPPPRWFPKPGDMPPPLKFSMPSIGHPRWYPADGRNAKALAFSMPDMPKPSWVPKPGTAPKALEVSRPDIDKPSWYPSKPGEEPDALKVTHPDMGLPGWYPKKPGEAPDALKVTHPDMGLPGWYPRKPGEAPDALEVKHPGMDLPDWYTRASFPLLKEKKKKEK